MRNLMIIGITLTILLIGSSCRKEINTVKSTINFEDVDLGVDGYWNGSDLSGGITVGNARFRNYYNADLNSWSGFAISNRKDTLTPGYLNQYSAVYGSGAKQTEKYAVLYSYRDDSIEFINPQTVKSISFCLSTYSYLSMKNGDSFAKKFGGTSGDDKDYFTIELAAITSNGRIMYFDSPIYMADLRFDDNSQDYIWKGWVTLDLDTVGFIKYLVIHLDSSDKTGDLINTPTYICIDEISGQMAN
jgi:hypothetical protein